MPFSSSPPGRDPRKFPQILASCPSSWAPFLTRLATHPPCAMAAPKDTVGTGRPGTRPTKIVFVIYLFLSGFWGGVGGWVGGAGSSFAGVGVSVRSEAGASGGRRETHAEHPRRGSRGRRLGTGSGRTKSCKGYSYCVPPLKELR